jgi:hypothetical protein
LFLFTSLRMASPTRARSGMLNPSNELARAKNWAPGLEIMTKRDSV